MSADEAAIIDLINQFGAAWNEHDLDAALALCTNDVVFESTGPAPDGQRAAGQVEVRAAWAPIFENVAAHFTTEDLFASDDRAVSTWSYGWGDGHVRGVDVMRVRDGKVCEKFSYVKG
jgi:ketosteroid isomerase-like protein